MFKKSRKKIVASILAVLVLLLFGTICVIYFASYMQMSEENRQLLRQYSAEYRLLDEPSPPQNDAHPDDRSASDSSQDSPPANNRQRKPPGRPPRLELSTFYSVAISKDGQVLKVDTADVSTLDEETLTELAFRLEEGSRQEGVEQDLIYKITDKGDYILAAFLDNTLMMDNARALITYTLIFGGAALVLLFFLSRYLAKRIVAPLEESYKRQKQFVSDAGHELKTPVAVVNANLELLSRQIGENQWLSNIQYENERMSALITQLLELAKTESTVPVMENVDLSRLVYGEVLPFETVAYEQGLTLNSQLEEAVFVNGNSLQLKQLVSILIDNALRHNQGGSEIMVGLKKERGHGILSVINRGEPIPEEQKSQLFERFYRADSARTAEDGHYGLGLAIAKNIASSHRGSIQVLCYEGKVEFSVKIPLKK